MFYEVHAFYPVIETLFLFGLNILGLRTATMSLQDAFSFSPCMLSEVLDAFCILCLTRHMFLLGVEYGCTCIEVA